MIFGTIFSFTSGDAGVDNARHHRLGDAGIIVAEGLDEGDEILVAARQSAEFLRIENTQIACLRQRVIRSVREFACLVELSNHRPWQRLVQ
jgi:hypothetical protein